MRFRINNFLTASNLLCKCPFLVLFLIYVVFDIHLKPLIVCCSLLLPAACVRVRACEVRVVILVAGGGRQSLKNMQVCMAQPNNYINRNPTVLHIFWQPWSTDVICKSNTLANFLCKLHILELITMKMLWNGKRGMLIPIDWSDCSNKLYWLTCYRVDVLCIH